jgi:hypothetical protein
MSTGFLEARDEYEDESVHFVCYTYLVPLWRSHKRLANRPIENSTYVHSSVVTNRIPNSQTLLRSTPTLQNQESRSSSHRSFPETVLVPLVLLFLAKYKLSPCLLIPFTSTPQGRDRDRLMPNAV